MTKPTLIGCIQALLALLLLGGIWLALPARWAWVDVPGTLLGVASALSAAALWARARWAPRFTRIVLWAELVAGTLLTTLLGMGIGQLAGSYGPVGAGGALLLGTIAALVLPYLVVFPALQLRALREPE